MATPDVPITPAAGGPSRHASRRGWAGAASRLAPALSGGGEEQHECRTTRPRVSPYSGPQYRDGTGSAAPCLSAARALAFRRERVRQWHGMD